MSFLKNIRKSSASARHVEEKLYEDVAKELGADIRREGLWTKAIEQSLGDETKIESLYIKLRIQSLKDEVLFRAQALEDKVLFRAQALEDEAQALEDEAQALEDEAQALEDKIFNAEKLYTDGLGYEIGKIFYDPIKAVLCYKKAAELGHLNAKYKLSIQYVEGIGCVKDYILAHMWRNLAASEGHKIASESLEKISKKMTPSQIKEAQKMAEDYMEKYK